MKKLLLLLFPLLLQCTTNDWNEEKPYIPSPPDSAALVLTSHGISWYFDQEYEHGTFANGDHWVAGAVQVIFIDPPSYTFKGRTRNGSMINPSPTLGTTQGYDSSMYGGYASDDDYSESLNVSLGVSPESPLQLAPNSSLVSAVSVDETGARPQLKTAAILTVLETAPAQNDFFRPPYCGTDKTPLYRTSSLLTEELAGLAPPDEGAPEISDVAGLFERPWIDHVPNWMGRCIHPSDNMPDYGREIATEVSIGALMLHLNIPLEDKMALLVRYVQLGIDLYGVIEDGGEENWVPNGGHASGRKWPILFAGIMLDDAGMRNIGQGGAGFGEDGQTFYVSQAEVDITQNSDAWDPDERAEEFAPYEAADIGLPEWGIVHSLRPEADNRGWITPYRQCCTAYSWAGFVLAAHIMDAVGLWNHDALFDYQDRYMQVSSSAGAYPGWRCTSDFVENMWDLYRAGYGTVWSE
ncbi:MAG TPA: hypothetical protein PK926_06340 [Spirochaetota bacterium]|nr:hypothetical protein [Spirochaetota bacterium]HPI91111.1 hypothetical protein [Spirochaetota bacterium]HPR48682.1 hypothetical protein [Spirochaetota bacterium]